MKVRNKILMFVASFLLIFNFISFTSIRLLEAPSNTDYWILIVAGSSKEHFSANAQYMYLDVSQTAPPRPPEPFTEGPQVAVITFFLVIILFILAIAIYKIAKMEEEALRPTPLREVPLIPPNSPHNIHKLTSRYLNRLPPRTPVDKPA